MRKISKEELKKILENHGHWIKRDVEGWENMRADLNGMDLSHADLNRMDLSYADLSGSNLCFADLRNTCFYGANLCSADLRGADFRWACLYKADLTRADLREADIHWADLDRAMLADQEIMNSILPICCPEEGSFIGWKKALISITQDDFCVRIPVIVKLRIPNGAKRSSATGRKCRCSEAKVLDIQDVVFSYTSSSDAPDGHSIAGVVQEAFSSYNTDFKYKIGETVRVEDFDENRWNECSTGIHFFITRQEAVDYVL